MSKIASTTTARNTARAARNAAIALANAQNTASKGDEMYQTNGAELMADLNTAPVTDVAVTVDNVAVSPVAAPVAVSLIHAERDTAQAQAAQVQAAKVTAKHERDNVSKGIAQAAQSARVALMADIYARQDTRTEGLLILAKQAVMDEFGRNGSEVKAGSLSAAASSMVAHIADNAGAALQSFLHVHEFDVTGQSRDFISHASALPDGHMFTIKAVSPDGKATALYYAVFGFKAGSGTSFKAERLNARVYKALMDMSVTEFSLTDRIAKLLKAGKTLNSHLKAMNNWALSQGAGVMAE